MEEGRPSIKSSFPSLSVPDVSAKRLLSYTLILSGDMPLFERRNYPFTMAFFCPTLVIYNSQKKIESMPFSFHTSWCTCGKPMEMRCVDPIPDDYFGNLSVRAAVFAHNAHLNETMRTEPLLVSWEDERRFVVDGRSWQLVFPDGAEDPCLVEATATSDYEFPADLTVEQCRHLEDRDWESFLCTLKHPKRKVDILLRIARRLVARVIASPDTVQVNVKGRVFLSEVHGACGDCSWTSATDAEIAPSHIVTPMGTLDTQHGVWS